MNSHEIIRKHFSLEVQFVEKHQLMKNTFSYKKQIKNINIEVTPCGKYLLVYIVE